MKKVACVIFSILAVVLFPLFHAKANETRSLSELSGCSRLYSYSGTGSAYFFGYKNYTLYSSRVIPDCVTRYISVSGIIRSVCHDENYAYALFDGSKSSCEIVRMNMNSGSCDYCVISDAQNISNRSFAVAGNEIFLIHNNSVYPYVRSYNFNGQHLNTYNFSQGVELLFCNGGKAYAKAYSGEIFRISGGNKTNCAVLDPYIDFQNAGAGYILSADKRLISLNGGNTENLSCNLAVKTEKERFTVSGSSLSFSGGSAELDSAKLMCAVGIKAAVLKNNFNCEILNAAELSPKSAGANIRTVGSLRLLDNIIIGIEPGTTVTQAEKKYPDIRKIYDSNRSEVTSGKLRTGYWAQTPEGEFEIALFGDVNGSGTVNSADTDDIMDIILGTKTVNGCYQKAADYNIDGIIDTKDLVLIGAKAHESKQ